MIEKVVSVKLPVDENMTVIKNHLCPSVLRGDEKRICIVTGTHGDELEGQYVCYELIRQITENISLLSGIVDIYPALNPLGIDTVSRNIPMYELDMNKLFPGSEEGAMPEHVAAEVINDISGADICVDIHSSDIFLREIPQVRISNETAPKLLHYAKMLNTDFVWVSDTNAVSGSSLAHNLNSAGTPALVIEMGVGQRVTRAYCKQLLSGIFNLMNKLGIWKEEVKGISHPMVSTDGHVSYIRAETSGLFVPAIEHWSGIQTGQLIGEIVSPSSGTVEQSITAPSDGLVFSLREYPVVYPGSLLARILGGSAI